MLNAFYGSPELIVVKMKRNDSDDLCGELELNKSGMCWCMVRCITVKGLKCVVNVSEANVLYVLCY